MGLGLLEVILVNFPAESQLIELLVIQLPLTVKLLVPFCTQIQYQFQFHTKYTYVRMYLSILSYSR